MTNKPRAQCQNCPVPEVCPIKKSQDETNRANHLSPVSYVDTDQCPLAAIVIGVPIPDEKFTIAKAQATK